MKYCVRLLIFFSIISITLTEKIHCIKKNNFFNNFSVKTSKVLELDKNTVTCSLTSYKEGWYIFNVTGNTLNFGNEEVSYYSGYLEGYIYHDQIDMHYNNILKTLLNNNLYNNQTLNFISKQLDYMYSLISNKTEIEYLIFQDESAVDIEDYLLTLKYVLKQFEGMYDGYYKKSTRKLKKEEFYLLTMQGDLEDISVAFNVSSNFPKNNSYWGKECTGIVKLLDDNLVVAHNTHNIYSLMMRIFKIYNLNLKINGVPLNNLRFSSRPADLNSKDDYYILDNNMMVLETSLAIYNTSLYENLRFNTIPKWMRVNIANRLARSGIEWIDYFFFKNSGTHNNQWLIIDFNKYENYRILKKEGKKTSNISGIIYLAEQLPILDKIYFEDMTNVLINKSYVASFNAPYFNETFLLSGRKDVNMTDYFHDNRYLLFERLNSNIFDIETMKPVIRYHDLSEMCDTIAPRCDISDNHPFGATDAKITDYWRIKGNKQSTIICGPSVIPGISEPFSFDKFPGYSHEGLPDQFNFTWVDI